MCVFRQVLFNFCEVRSLYLTVLAFAENSVPPTLRSASGNIISCAINYSFIDFLFKVYSPSKNCFIYFNESPLEIMKNAAHFILKVLFVLKIFKGALT